MGSGSLTRIRPDPGTPCLGSSESQPLDHQESPISLSDFQSMCFVSILKISFYPRLWRLWKSLYFLLEAFLFYLLQLGIWSTWAYLDLVWGKCFPHGCQVDLVPFIDYDYKSWSRVCVDQTLRFCYPKGDCKPRMSQGLWLWNQQHTLRLKRKALWPPLKESDIPWGRWLWAPNRVPQSGLDWGVFTPVQGWLLLCRLRHPILPGSQSWWAGQLALSTKIFHCSPSFDTSPDPTAASMQLLTNLAPSSPGFYIFLNKVTHLFIFDCTRSSLLYTDFLKLQWAGAALSCGARASHGGGFSCGAQALGCQAQ